MARIHSAIIPAPLPLLLGLAPGGGRAGAAGRGRTSLTLVQRQGVKMGERYTFWLSFLNNMREAATRTDSVSLPCNPYPPDTAEHERWWADLIGSRLSNSDNP
jgi:hypothetical protein